MGSQQSRRQSTFVRYNRIPPLLYGFTCRSISRLRFKLWRGLFILRVEKIEWWRCWCDNWNSVCPRNFANWPCFATLSTFEGTQAFTAHELLENKRTNLVWWKNTKNPGLHTTSIVKYRKKIDLNMLVQSDRLRKNRRPEKTQQPASITYYKLSNIAPPIVLFLYRPILSYRFSGSFWPEKCLWGPIKAEYSSRLLGIAHGLTCFELIMWAFSSTCERNCIMWLLLRFESPRNFFALVKRLCQCLRHLHLVAQLITIQGANNKWAALNLVKERLIQSSTQLLWQLWNKFDAV